MTLDFVRDVQEAFTLPDPVVEIGARPAEGQEAAGLVRDLFPGRDFTGCDLFEGPNVDRVEDVHALTFADESVGTLVSIDTLEHVADPLRAVREMQRVLKPGGVCVIASVMFFPVHAHPWDYWRFTPEGFALLLEPFESRFVCGHGHPLLPESVLGVGVKGPHAEVDLAALPRTAGWIRAWSAGRPVDVGPIRMSVGELWRMTARETAGAARRTAVRSVGRARRVAGRR